MRRWFLVILPVNLLGCAIPRAEASPEGTFEKFRPEHPEWQCQAIPRLDYLMCRRFPKNKWLVSLELAKDQTSLILKSGPKSFALVRSTKDRLLATSFISWSWRMSAENHATGAIRLIVGFYGGDPKSPS